MVARPCEVVADRPRADDDGLVGGGIRAGGCFVDDGGDAVGVRAHGGAGARTVAGAEVADVGEAAGRVRDGEEDVTAGDRPPVLVPQRGLDERRAEAIGRDDVRGRGEGQVLAEACGSVELGQPYLVEAAAGVTQPDRQDGGKPNRVREESARQHHPHDNLFLTKWCQRSRRS